MSDMTIPMLREYNKVGGYREATLASPGTGKNSITRAARADGWLECQCFAIMFSLRSHGFRSSISIEGTLSRCTMCRIPTPTFTHTEDL
jgi:hypothetical protein